MGLAYISIRHQYNDLLKALYYFGNKPMTLFVWDLAMLNQFLNIEDIQNILTHFLKNGQQELSEQSKMRRLL